MPRSRFRPALLRPLVASCLWAGSALAEPLFENSVVSNDIDFIASSDPQVPGCLRYEGTATREKPGGPTEELMAAGVHVFEVEYADGSRVGLWVHPLVGAQPEAQAVAGLVVGPVGRLPALMRQDLSHVVIHSGDRPAFGEHLGRFFVLYDGNMRQRIATDDLEETVFHESVHATLDAEWAESEEWRRAQAQDAGFITAYAAERPQGEDLAESALFAFAYLRHPERLPPEVARGIEAIMPARLAFFERLFGAPEPEPPAADLPADCLSVPAGG